jgi:hypothetical protein
MLICLSLFYHSVCVNQAGTSVSGALYCCNTHDRSFWNVDLLGDCSITAFVLLKYGLAFRVLSIAAIS